MKCFTVCNLNCVSLSDNATVIGTNNDLGFGTNSVDLNSYKVSYGGVIEDYFSVTAAGCIPVFESFRGTLEGSKSMLDSNVRF